jgi:uncharacterized protein (TIGR03437 family)
MKIRLAVVSLVSILASLSWAPLQAGTPVSTYGTYFGGTGDTNVAVAICLDPSGNVIVAGYTTSQTLPGTANAFQPTKATGFPDNRDVFIAKFDPTGQDLLWASFLGGDGDDIPTAVAVDPAGSVNVIGTTNSSTFPLTSGAYSEAQSFPGGFAAKISADGRTLLYSTYLPGTPNALALNAGDAYIAGVFLPTVITAGALGNGANPGDDDGVYLLDLNSTGSDLVFGAYLGGDGFTGSKVTSLSISPEGNVYVAGYTGESILTTANEFQVRPPTISSSRSAGMTAIRPDAISHLMEAAWNGFIVEVNPSGSQLIYGTYFNPPYSSTEILSIVASPDGSVYLAGLIQTSALWATPGAYLTTPSPGFVAKLTPGSSVLDAFSYIPSPPLLEIGNQPEMVYAIFDTPGVGPTEGFEVAELSVSALALVSSFTTPFKGGPTSAVLAPPHSLWLAGQCESPCSGGSLGSLISSNAFQPTPQSPSAAVMIQLTDISPTILAMDSSATGTPRFAAGQLVSIYGTQLGPAQGSGAQIGPDGSVTASNGSTEVLFDGTPAPILYTSAGQVNTVIPCSVAGHSSTQMMVEYLGVQSAPMTVALSPAAPGIFTDDGSGTGQGAILNQNYSFNSASNPAPRGSIAIFYATGVGPTSPCVDGKIYESDFPTLTLPVIVGVGGTGAQVLYAGQAPYLVSGVAQLNVVIPSDAGTGVVPLTLVVDGIFSKAGVTIAVK